MLILAACVCAYVTSFFSLMSAVQAAGGSAVHAAQHIEVFKFVRIVLGCVSVLGMLGIIAGIPLGIWYLSKDEDIPGVVYDERSGHGTASVVPPELRRWSWGAAGLTWIWGARHRVWIALVALVPGISIFIMILLGLRGNEYAWRAKKYESVDDLLHQEEVWKLWGIVFFIFHVLGILWLRYTTA